MRVHICINVYLSGYVFLVKNLVMNMLSTHRSRQQQKTITFASSTILCIQTMMRITCKHGKKKNDICTNNSIILYTCVGIYKRLSQHENVFIIMIFFSPVIINIIPNLLNFILTLLVNQYNIS